jgi:hypothetical protein
VSLRGGRQSAGLAAAGRGGRSILAAALILATSSLGRCSVAGSPPAPTPGDIETVAAKLAQQGIAISDVVAGDAGCADQRLAGPAISFRASGLDQGVPVKVYLYSFRSRSVFEARRDAVDACARSYVSDPASYENLATSPYVVAGQGPWATAFKSHLLEGLTAAAGNGG